MRTIPFHFDDLDVRKRVVEIHNEILEAPELAVNFSKIHTFVVVFEDGEYYFAGAKYVAYNYGSSLKKYFAERQKGDTKMNGGTAKRHLKTLGYVEFSSSEDKNIINRFLSYLSTIGASARSTFTFMRRDGLMDVETEKVWDLYTSLSIPQQEAFDFQHAA